MGKLVGMLEFDIECTGLDRFKDHVTVASVYNPDVGIERNFNFCVGDVEGAKREFMQHLDDAEIICAFNGVRFDLPFIIQQFGVPPQRWQLWFVKIFDYFEVCKTVFGSSCGLNKLLQANGEEVKTSSGLQAVEWAKEGKWLDLEDYCMMDTKLTHKISMRGEVVLPLTGKAHMMRCYHDAMTHSLSFEAL